MFDDMTKAMFGCHAVQSGLNMIVQDQGDGTVIVIGQSRVKGQHPLRFGSQRTHVLCMGDIVVRPHLVFGSDEFRGEGLTGLVRSGFCSADKWTRGDTILENLPSRYKELMKHKR